MLISDAQKLCTMLFPWHMEKKQIQTLTQWYQNSRDPDVFKTSCLRLSKICNMLRTDHKNNIFNSLKASDRILRLFLFLEEYGVTFEYLSGKIQKIMALLRILYPVLILRAWRFKITKKKNYPFSQDQKKTAVSLISNHQSQCILPWSSENKQKSRNQDQEKRALSNLITQYIILKDMIYFATNITSKIYNHQSLRQRTKSTVQVPWIFISSRTDNNRKDYQEYHDMVWSYTTFWTLIIYVPFVKHVKWQRRTIKTRNMRFFHPKYQNLTLYPWIMIWVDLVGPWHTIDYELKR
jgi:hypothetical protein